MKTKRMIVTVGNCASSKTTWATNFVKENPGWIITGRDAVRKMFSNDYNNHDYEDHVTDIVNHTITLSLRKGYNVIVDNTSLRKEYRDKLFKLAQSVGDVHYEEKVFKTPLEECLKRNAAREKKVPEKVLHEYARIGRHVLSEAYIPRQEYIPPLPRFEFGNNSNQSLPKAIICDIDGTCAYHVDRNPYDTAKCESDLPILPVMKTIELFQNDGYQIIFVSGRDSEFRQQTENWLKQHWTMILPNNTYDVPRPYELFMRPNKDTRPDYIVKEEIYNNFIKDKYDVMVAIDDRPTVIRMWRYTLGLTVFQMNDREF